MACARCSSSISRGDQFCPRCGARVSLLAPSDPSAAPVQAALSASSKSAAIAARLSSLSSEPRNELAALALTGLGGALALISFFLPWAPDNGIAIGATGNQPRPGAWAFDTPAGWPLFFITLLLLGSVAAGSKAQEVLPGLASTIGRLTEIVAPLVLGGGLLGVALLYLTLPWGYGGGLVALTLGACLLVAGAIVALFFPSASPGEDRPA
jgi:hypothetical protein